jgi:hypothetical protein
MSKVEEISVEAMEIKVTIAKGQEFVQVMAKALIAMLDAHRAVNYVESRIETAEGVPLSITIQRIVDGKSPHDLRLEAERRVQILTLELDACHSVIKDLQSECIVARSQTNQV